jgi:molybdopterin-guanine dinucleotide biosynthesis protein A
VILGVVLAGGPSTRFGSDKALAELGGHTLLAHAVDRLSGWCEYVVVAGRAMAPAPTIPDSPGPGMGPLAGIAAGLRLAQDEGYEAALAIGVGSLGLPENLPELLGPAPAYLDEQPVVGLWPASAATALERFLASEGDRSVSAFAHTIGARAVKATAPLLEIVAPADLAAAEKRFGH